MIGEASELAGVGFEVLQGPERLIRKTDPPDMPREGRLHENGAADLHAFDRGLEVVGFRQEIRINDGRVLRLCRAKPNCSPAPGPQGIRVE